MRLRQATKEDSELLLKWRNDSGTRLSSRNEQEIKKEEHDEWLRRTFRNSNRKLYIAEIDNKPVGTVRADYDGQYYELSWTVAPEERGKGIGKKMVSLIIERIKKPTRAEVKINNLASRKIAEYVGMSLDYTRAGLMYFSKE